MLKIRQTNKIQNHKLKAVNSAIKKKIDALRKFQNETSNIVVVQFVEQKHLIQDYITDDQLYDRGIRGDGVLIHTFQPYTRVTVEMKKMKGQPHNRVTLKDTGDFHASIDLQRKENEVLIFATDWKTGELIEKYGEQILWLLPENLSDIIWSYIYPRMLDELKNLL